ncbi:MAG: 1-acyl-sn-glycerol-3-phosphate acyltransferase [Pseudomonadales bacterium]|nr:1-acyl-sn-glycerol-3-phosphate acyltransferase [Pseudomonadales bacterium]
MNQHDLHQEWLDDFEIISHFDDSLVKSETEQLVQHPNFLRQLHELFDAVMPNQDNTDFITLFLNKLRTAQTIDELQHFELKFLQIAMASTLKQVETIGLDQLDPAKNYLFISNHRDILLDPMLLNWALLTQEFGSCHCAIGDNLLIDESGNRVARLNKCFAVLRSVKSPKAMVRALRTQSAFIRHLFFNKQGNIWIAQREGRSKDNTDQTNPALIKMLGLGKPKEMGADEYLQQLRIVPVSLSYEWDPCDLQKARDLIEQEQGEYVRAGLSDLQAVRDGLIGHKGRIVFNFDADFHKNSALFTDYSTLTRAIDQSIQSRYRLFPVNYAAAELLNNSVAPESPDVTSQNIDQAKDALIERLGDATPLERERVLQSYAQPLLTFQSRHRTE